MINKGLYWWQSNNEADIIKKIHFIFNPQIYTIENLEKTNSLILYSLNLWNKYGINNHKERNDVEKLERQYYNNKRRIYHLQKFYSAKIIKLTKKLEKLSII
jgi:hypothetical protein